MRVIVSENLFKIIDYYNREPDGESDGKPNGNENVYNGDVVIIENRFEFDERDIEYIAKKAIDNKTIMKIITDLKTKIEELSNYEEGKE